MAVQNQEKTLTVTVYDGEIILRSPRFGDYLDMYIREDAGDVDEEEEVVEKPDTLSQDQFLALATTLVLRWSYPEPVTKENIAKLDSKTSVVLLAAINELLGVGSGKATQTPKVSPDG